MATPCVRFYICKRFSILEMLLNMILTLLPCKWPIHKCYCIAIVTFEYFFFTLQRFIQYIASKSATWMLQNFLDKNGVQGKPVSLFHIENMFLNFNETYNNLASFFGRRVFDLTFRKRLPSGQLCYQARTPSRKQWIFCNYIFRFVF